MIRSGLIRVFIVLMISLSNTTLATESQDVYGEWLTEGDSAQIRIEACEQGVCGTLIWLNPNSLNAGETAETVKDFHNKDPELAQRNLLGLTMLWGFEPGKQGWKGGKIYDPESGKTYASKIKRLDNNILQVKGCISLFCQSQSWKKVDPQD